LRQSNFSRSLGMVTHAQGSRAIQRSSVCRLLALLTIQGLFVIIAGSETVDDAAHLAAREPAFLAALDSDLATVELCHRWLARAFVATAVLFAGVSVLRIGPHQLPYSMSFWCLKENGI
jgi:hypothetical protein